MWSDKKPVGKTDWVKVHAHVKLTDYSTFIKKKPTYPYNDKAQFYYNDKKTDIEYFSLSQRRRIRSRIHHIPFSRVYSHMNTIAELYRNTTWEGIFKTVHENHPGINLDCALGVVSPFTNSLQWLSIPCQNKLNQSLLICKLADRQSNLKQENEYVIIINIELGYITCHL